MWLKDKNAVIGLSKMNPLPKDSAVNKSLTKKPAIVATPTVKPFKPAQPTNLQPFKPAQPAKVVMQKPTALGLKSHAVLYPLCHIACHSKDKVNVLVRRHSIRK